MVRLTPHQRRTMGAGSAVLPSAILAVHGAITAAWAVLDLLNLVSDQLPKEAPARGRPAPDRWTLSNDLMGPRTTIYS